MFCGWRLAAKKQSKTLRGGGWLPYLPFVRCWLKPGTTGETGQVAVQTPEDPALIGQFVLLRQEISAGDAEGQLAF